MRRSKTLYGPLAAVASLALVATTVPVSGARSAPVTAYQMPFPCGETWVGSTRASHSPSVKSIDWNRVPDAGAPVVAAATGTVTTAQASPSGGYGRWVVIDHGNGESSLYAHLSSVTVAVGQLVDQGTMIGTVGDSGNSRGTHLHFEQKSGRTVVDSWFGGVAFKPGSTTSANCLDVPMAGNFTGDAAAETAVFRRAKRSSFVLNVAGAAPVRFGKAFDQPILGDWNGDGQVDLGVRTPKKSKFKLRTATGVTKVKFGVASDRPISGDWDGDGVTEIGVHRSNNGTFWQRRADGSTAPVWLGDADDLPVTGDWNGDRITDLGVFDRSTATFTLRTVDAGGLSLLSVIQFGSAGDWPVVGDWDGNRVTDISVCTPTTATLSQGYQPLMARAAASVAVARQVPLGRARPTR